MVNNQDQDLYLSPQNQIAVLAKAPLFAKVKTRLTQASAKSQTRLSHWEALQFHRWSIYAVVQKLCPKALEQDLPLLFVSQAHSFWSKLSLAQAPQLQKQGHLGIKMYQALQDSFSLLCKQSSLQDAVLLLGTDSPHLDPNELKKGFRFLNQSLKPALIIGPAEDGGYYTIGCNRQALEQVQPVFLNNIEWGSDKVFKQTLSIAKTLDLEIKVLSESFDIDRPQDLEKARKYADLDWHNFDKLITPHPLAAPQQIDKRQEYKHALSLLFDLTRFGERMDLSAPRAINQALGNPLATFKNILIGGTNGKGSTCAALSQIALQTGKKVGCFTSPHLVSFRERIRVGDELISHQEVVEGVQVIFKLAKQSNLSLSFFEATWALAAWCFSRRRVDWVIWEVGLGGRLDATNTCEPILSAITSISLDHTHILGNTLAEIAAEKSPIFRANGISLTACQGEALDALRSVSSVKAQSVEDRIQDLEDHYQTWLCKNEQKELSTIYAGSLIMNKHGRRNLALALACAKELAWFSSNQLGHISIDELLSVKWPGRLEYQEELWLDCAHNPDSARYLTMWLSQQQAPRHLIIGMSADKDISKVLLLLAQNCEKITFVSPRYPRCTSAENLAHIFETELRSRLEDITTTEQVPGIAVEPNLERAICDRDSNALNLICGSCFLVGEARALLLGLEFPELDLRTSAR